MFVTGHPPRPVVEWERENLSHLRQNSYFDAGFRAPSMVSPSDGSALTLKYTSLLWLFSTVKILFFSPLKCCLRLARLNQLVS